MRKNELQLPLMILCVSFASSSLFAETKHLEFAQGNQRLVIEVQSDSIIHAEYRTGKADQSIYTTPMVDHLNFNGPKSFSQKDNSFTTTDLEVSIDPSNLCARFDDLNKGQYLTTICPEGLGQGLKKLHLDASTMENAYGLGENFKRLGSADGDWVAHGTRDSMHMGNGFQTFENGAVGNIQIPILYAVGNQASYGLFLDNVYKQDWDFTQNWWNVRTYGDQLRFFFIAGSDLKTIRSRYLSIVGHAPVPPKKTFGLWMSKFGYHGWEEIDQTKNEMRKRSIPFDGFVLDINWFGSINLEQPEKSRMGFLEWDQSNTDGNDNYFPNPEAKLAQFKKENIGFTAIEESYVVDSSSTYKEMFAKKLFSFKRNGGECQSHGERQPIWLNAWWGRGGMIDWSNPQAGAWFHDNKRLQNLIRLGVTNHWTDLGEPEMYDASACYQGVEAAKNTHGDVHNIYNLLWNKSIWEGYARHNKEINLRPFIMTRSGAAGSQRFGTGIWSADIASSLKSLATHMNAQMHMSLSGVDYFSNDAGGFRKEIMPGNDKSGRYRGYEAEMYSMWLANSAWFDIPLRPHTDNDFSMAYAPSPLWPPYETAPYLVGDEYSNKMNIIQRYELVPYYYSLAYRAHLAGEAVMPPLVYYFQDDQRLRTVGHQKMIGPNLMVGVVANHGEYKRDIILPRAGWYNYHNNQFYDGQVQDKVKDVPTYIDGVLRVPVFAKAGAIIPQMNVTSATMDVFNHQKNGGIDRTLLLKVYQGPESSFTLYEDDGTTLSFDANTKPIYKTQQTKISQRSTDNAIEISIAAASGETQGFDARPVIVKVVSEKQEIESVTLNHQDLHQLTQPAKDNQTGWYFNQELREVIIYAGTQAISKTIDINVELSNNQTDSTSVSLACHNGWTAMGEKVAAVFDTGIKGQEKVVIPMEPSIYYQYIWSPSPYAGERPGPTSPIWTKVITQAKIGTQAKWSCAKISADGRIIHQGLSKLISVAKNNAHFELAL